MTTEPLVPPFASVAVIVHVPGGSRRRIGAGDLPQRIGTARGRGNTARPAHTRCRRQRHRVVKRHPRTRGHGHGQRRRAHPICRNARRARGDMNGGRRRRKVSEGVDDDVYGGGAAVEYFGGGSIEWRQREALRNSIGREVDVARRRAARVGRRIDGQVPRGCSGHHRHIGDQRRRRGRKTFTEKAEALAGVRPRGSTVQANSSIRDP